MATSTTMLGNIISSLAKKYQFNENDAIAFLAKNDMLPKKMIPQDNKEQSCWASKRAQEFAEEHGIVPKGNGSGKDGRWTLADVQKELQKPIKDKVQVSPNALVLAKENKINLVGVKGSGKEGRILLKDVEAIIENSNSSDDSRNITARAYNEALELHITDEELDGIKGTGQDGRIILKDVQDYFSSSNDEKQKKKRTLNKGKKPKEKQEQSEEDTEEEECD